MKPKKQLTNGQLHVRYDLPYQIHDSVIYPIPAPDGSTVIVCGHEQGLTVFWRGSQHEYPASEESKGELNPREHYLPILEQSELPLGTAVLHISFPEPLPSTKPSELHNFPSLFQHTLVVALACADLTIRLLTLPLSPPSPESKARPKVISNIIPGLSGHGLYGEQLLTLNGNITHQTLPKGVSVALAPRLVETTNEEHMGNEVRESRTQINTTKARASSLQEHDSSDNVRKSQWDLLIASHSTDLTGLLLIHRIPLQTQSLQIDAESSNQDFLWRVQYLTEPATRIQLHVSLHFEKRRWPAVLIAEARGAVRIYDCCSASNQDLGTWSLSLYLNNYFLRGGLSMARTLLDAKWALAGKAIVVLTLGGEWGVWDLGTDHGVSGGIPTKFAMNGWLGNSSQSLNSSKGSISRPDTKTKFAPMTPSTRMSRQKDLFTGSANNSRISSSGGISVYPNGINIGDGRNDESVIIWHGDQIIMMPSLKKHWQNRIDGSESLFGDGQIRHINSVPLGGEVCRSISMFPQEDSHVRMGQQFVQPDLLFVGERCLELLALPFPKAQNPVQHSLQMAEPITDQHLLARGELDVGGMDRILANM